MASKAVLFVVAAFAMFRSGESISCFFHGECAASDSTYAARCLPDVRLETNCGTCLSMAQSNGTDVITYSQACLPGSITPQFCSLPVSCMNNEEGFPVCWNCCKTDNCTGLRAQPVVTPVEPLNSLVGSLEKVCNLSCPDVWNTMLSMLPSNVSHSESNANISELFSLLGDCSNSGSKIKCFPGIKLLVRLYRFSPAVYELPVASNKEAHKTAFGDLVASVHRPLSKLSVLGLQEKNLVSIGVPFVEKQPDDRTVTLLMFIIDRELLLSAIPRARGSRQQNGLTEQQNSVPQLLKEPVEASTIPDINTNFGGTELTFRVKSFSQCLNFDCSQTEDGYNNVFNVEYARSSTDRVTVCPFHLVVVASSVIISLAAWKV